ncbi:MAG: CRISPR-associated endonuclease Cas1 [Polaromonas sp.]
MLNPTPAATPGARALYLGARDKKQVSCTDEALVVRNETQQIRRYPLARVSRVVSSTVTDWSGGALALCLKSGIGITWMDGQGNALGTCYPHRRHYPSFATAVELLTETPEGLVRYQNWLRSRRMEVLMRWSKTRTDAIHPESWESTKREWVYGQHFSAHLPMGLRGHCLAWVGAQLAAQGLHPQLWGPDVQPIDLDHDLCELLWAEMNLCAGSLADADHTSETSANLFERWNAANGSALLLHISSLYRTAMKTLP